MTGLSLDSLQPGYRALVFGASGGVGAAMLHTLAADPRCGAIHAASRRQPEAMPTKATWHAFDLEDEASIARTIAAATADGPLDLVIVATGMLHDAAIRPEKTWRALDGAALDKAFRINAAGPALIARHALDHLPRDRKAVFAALSARVGSISDNRLGGWHAYRASKAALNMIVKTCAIELARRNPHAACVTLHPGTVDTALSRPFQSGVTASRLFTADHSARCLLEVIDALKPGDSGKLLAWDGAEIPF